MNGLTDTESQNGSLSECFGPYRNLVALASGGTSDIFSIVGSQYPPLIIKALKPALATDPWLCACFLRGGEKALQVDHENVVTVREVHGGPRPYLVMDYGGHPSIHCFAIRRAACSAIERAWSNWNWSNASFISRPWGCPQSTSAASFTEISSPRMSSWTRTGGFVSRISVWRGLDPADRYTEPGNAPGTPHYMSPEQIRGQGFEQSDIWGFGVLAYQLLTTDSLETRVPFFGYSAADLLRRIEESDPKPPRSLNPQIPYDLETIVLKCLRKDKADRYKDGAELVLDLERFRNKEQIKARREGNLQRLKRKCRTNRIYARLTSVVVAFALLIFFGSMSSSVLFLHLKRNADEQKERAEDRETKMARMASHRLIESANLSGDRGDYAAKALKLAYVQTLMREEDPQARVNAVRLGTALKQCPIPLQIWPQSEGANQLAFNHEGTRVAVASGDKVHIYDVATGTVAGPPLEHPGPVSSIAFSPDGKRLASGCRNETRLTPNSPLRNLTEGEGEARLWDVATGRLLVGPMVLGLSVSRVGFTQSNWVVALGRIWEAGTGIHDALQVWDGNDGRSLSRPVSLSGDLIAVAFSPNGRHLAVSWRDLVGSRATLWDLKEMRAFPLVRTDTGHKDGSRYRILTSLAFSPAGDWLLTAGDDGRLDIWDATSGQPSGGPLEAREKVAIVKAAFSPTGIIAAASEDKTVRVWHSASRRLIGRPIKYDQPVTDLAFGPDGVSLICASQDGTIRVWDGNTGDPLGPVLVHTGAPVQAQWSPDGLALLTAGQDGCVRLWDATVFGSWGQAWNLPRGVNGPVWYNHGGEQILVPSDDTARIYEATTGRPVTPVLPHKARVVRAWFSPDDRYVITLATLVDHRGNLYFWDATSGASLVAPIEDAGEVTDVCWRPDGIGLAISATGNMCSMSKYSGISYVWELDPRVPKIRQVAQLDHERVVNNAVIHPDGRLAATATGQFDEPGEAGVWDVASGKLVRPSFPHPRKVNSVAFSPDARNLVTGCDDGHARIFEIRSGVLEREIRLGYPVTRVLVTPDGYHLVTVAGDAHNAAVRVWELATGLPVGQPIRTARQSFRPQNSDSPPRHYVASKSATTVN